MVRLSVITRSTVLAAALGAAGACAESPFEDLTRAIDGELVNSDTTLIVTESAIFRARAIYRVGPGTPVSMRWAVSDTAILGIGSQPDLTASVIAKASGDAWVYGLINEEFLDSARVTVVARGTVKWRRPLAAAPTAYVAIDDSNRVYVTTTTGQMVVLTADGDTVRTQARCAGALGPSVFGTSALTTGAGCVDRTSGDGSTAWTLGFGDAQGGVALAADEATLVPSVESGAGGDAVVLSRVSLLGATLWRDTVVAGTLAPASAPAIGVDGAIYLPWRLAADSSRLTKWSAAGQRRWTATLPAPVRRASPAVVGNRVYVAHEGGLTVLDTAGGLVWGRLFSDADPGIPAATVPSSPIVDRNGVIVVQTPAALLSYSAAGDVRWVADTLGGGDATLGVGAPTLLGDDVLLVSCGGEICGVALATGGLVWRSTVGGGMTGGVAVGLDGTLFAARATTAGGELVALWNRRLVALLGWPTEGDGADRGRRER